MITFLLTGVFMAVLIGCFGIPQDAFNGDLCIILALCVIGDILIFKRTGGKP